MKFSIITPIYNSYHLMSEFLNCLEEQTFKDFEVILVDDCSTDDTYTKIVDYAKNSNLNMRVLKNEKNSGPGPSRNHGIEHSKGNYITFIDSDDYIKNNSLDIINDLLENVNPDCLIFDYYVVRKGELKKASSVLGEEEGWVNKEAAIAYSTGSTWCKVYKREIIEDNNIIFPDLMRFEDLAFNKITISHCDSIYYLKVNLYHYKLHNESIVHSIKHVNEKYPFEAFKIIESKLKHKYKEQVELIFIRELLYSTVMLLALKKVKTKDIILEIDSLEQLYPNWFYVFKKSRLSLNQRIVLNAIKVRNILVIRFMAFLKKITR